jgi:hypothetical protein
MVACSGGAGGGSSNPTVGAAPAAPAAPAVTATPPSSSSSTTTPRPSTNHTATPTPVSTGSSASPTPTGSATQANLLYVALGSSVNDSNPRIEAFPLNTGGNIAPVKTINNYQNSLYSPSVLAFDTSGNLYVANDSFSGTEDYITVFAPGANGNATPVRIIGGTPFSPLGKAVIEGLAVDAIGYVYVALLTSADNCTSSTCTAMSNDTILVFSPGANGNASPVRSISTSACYGIGGIAVTPSGELIVACMPPPSNGSAPAVPYGFRRNDPITASRMRLMSSSQSGAEIETFSPDASGNATPLSIITGSNTQLSGAGAVALSPLGSIVVLPRYVQTGQVLTFAQSATGNAAPTTDVNGPLTQLTGQGGVTVDAAGDMYVLDTQSAGSQTYITEYSNNEDGNSTPINMISGSNTGLAWGFFGIAIGPP